MRHFARTLEAIIRPDIGKTRKHFIYRGRLFVGRSAEMSDLLGDIYDLRSCAEHMNDIQELYPSLSQEEINKRTELVEIVTSSRATSESARPSHVPSSRLLRNRRRHGGRRPDRDHL